MENWRSTKMPVLRVKDNWRNTMVEDEAPKLEENKREILEVVNQRIKELKPQLRNEVKQLVQRDIKPAKDGKDAAQWHSDLDSGKEGDFAFVEGDFYQHREGEWKFLFSAKPKKNVMVTGGVSESFVNQAINNALADYSPGGVTEVIVTITDDYSVTNETHVHGSISAEKTVTLPATNTRKVRVKNSLQSTANLIVASTSTFDGQSGWTINPGSSFDFTYLGAGAYDVT